MRPACRPGADGRRSPSITCPSCPARRQSPPRHTGPGTQLPFAGGHNFRGAGRLRGRRGQASSSGDRSTAAFPTVAAHRGGADRKLLDSLGLRLILDLRSEAEAAEHARLRARRRAAGAHLRPLRCCLWVPRDSF